MMGERKEEDDLESIFLTKKWLNKKKPSVQVLFSLCSTYIKSASFLLFF